MTRKLLLVLLLWAFSFSALADARTTPYDVAFTYVLEPEVPNDLHGYRLAVGYQPKSLIWERMRLYFDASFGHWWVPGAPANQSLSIYALAPFFHVTVIQDPVIEPFVEFSIGPAYLTRTRIDTRNLGMHFTFQDELGFGLSVGRDKRLSVKLSALHYSNGSLCNHNSGITVPLLLSVNYLF